MPRLKSITVSSSAYPPSPSLDLEQIVKPTHVNNAWNQLSGLPHRKACQAAQMAFSHAQATALLWGAEIPAQPVVSSGTMKEKVGLPRRGMKCGVMTYE